MYIDIHDWEQFYATAAESQGWFIHDIGARGNPEIILEFMQGFDHSSAVQRFKDSYLAGHGHAVSAHSIIRRENPREFHYWNMDGW